MTFKVGPLEFVNPLKVPFERRCQTVAMSILSFIYFYGIFFFPFLFIYLLFTPLYFISLLYGAWMYWDRDTPRRGGRPNKWLTNGWFWTRAVDYYPLKLHKTAELDPSKKYLMGYHPHGLMIVGVFAMAVNSTFPKLFKGMRVYLSALDLWFKIPVIRELGLGWHGISANAESIEYVLKNSDPGTATVLIVGGAKEVLLAQPGTMRILLKNRKGFVKLAMRNGAQLVPIIAFGQNDIYKQFYLREGHWFRRMQFFFTKYRGIPIPFFTGRGIFNYNFGMLPHRREMNVVIGKPLETPHIVAPSQEDIDSMHAKYIEAVKELYDTHKDRFAKDRIEELQIL